MLRIQNLKKRFGSKVVLDGVNLNIADGQTFVLLGPSGTGKSVLLKHLVGLLAPDEGEILWDDRKYSELDARARRDWRLGMGMLFQGSALFDSLSVEENVGFGLLEHTQESLSAIRARVRECLDSVGLKDASALLPQELSGGMKKRVALARAIALKPRVLLYDEPTTGLDPVTADTINELMVQLKKNMKVTSIVVTHDMASALKVADRIGMLSGGQIVAEGSVNEFIHSAHPLVRGFLAGFKVPA